MVESLIQYCQENNRVCPMPDAWNRLWEMLPGKQQLDGGWQPPVPLILGGWWYSSAIEKRLRLLEHLRYAESSGVLEQVDSFLRGLSEKEWAHMDDF
jgi:hypothetical protein